MNQNPKELRAKYIQNPPDGIIRNDILHVSTDDLLEMDYFLNENNFDANNFDEKGFYIFYPNPVISILYQIELYY